MPNYPRPPQVIWGDDKYYVAALRKLKLRFPDSPREFLQCHHNHDYEHARELVGAMVSCLEEEFGNDPDEITRVIHAHLRKVKIEKKD